jgi:hypothetical protein
VQGVVCSGWQGNTTSTDCLRKILETNLSSIKGADDQVYSRTAS